MTPVREALETAPTVIEQLERVLPRLREDIVASFAIGCAIDTLRALSAAPGEPCAWVKRLADNWRGRRDSLTGDSIRDSCADELEEVAARHTPPQPAAGWDALRANLREAWSALALIRETVETLGPVGAMPASENLDGPTFMHEAEAIVQGIQLTALRREAPAPAEGVKPVVSIVPMELSDDRMDYFVSIKVGDREVTPHVFREEYKAAYHVALYDWLLNGTGEEPDCVEFGPKDWPARVMSARTDTAEARLREALDVAHGKFCKIAGTEVWTDGCLDGWRRSPGALREYAEMAASEIDNALSPPSGGDEAKKSEGGCICQDQHRRGYCTEPGCPYAVRPSEPSPPADRREIVARPRVSDNDRDEITVTLDGKELRGWSYTNDQERRTKTLCAREFVEGFCTGRES